MGQINYYIENGLHKEAKMKALELNMTFKELLIESLKDFIDTK